MHLPPRVRVSGEGGTAVARLARELLPSNTAEALIQTPGAMLPILDGASSMECVEQNF